MHERPFIFEKQLYDSNVNQVLQSQSHLFGEVEGLGGMEQEFFHNPLAGDQWIKGGQEGKGSLDINDVFKIWDQVMIKPDEKRKPNPISSQSPSSKLSHGQQDFVADGLPSVQEELPQPEQDKKPVWRIGVISNRSIKITEDCFWKCVGHKPADQKVIPYQQYIEGNCPGQLTEKKEYVMECAHPFTLSLENANQQTADTYVEVLNQYEPKKSTYYKHGVKFMIKRKAKKFDRSPKHLIVSTKDKKEQCGPFLIGLRKRTRVEFLEFLQGKRLTTIHHDPNQTNKRNQWKVKGYSEEIQQVVDLKHGQAKQKSAPNFNQQATNLLQSIQPLPQQEQFNCISSIMQQLHTMYPEHFQQFLDQNTNKRKRDDSAAGPALKRRKILAIN